MNKIDRYLLYMMSTILFINFIATVTLNLESTGVLILCVLIVGILIYNELFILDDDTKKVQFYIMTIIIIVSTLYILIKGNGDTIRIFFYMIMYQLYRRSNKLIIVFMYVCIFSILFYNIYRLTESVSEFIKDITLELTLFLLVSTIIVMITYILKQNKQLEVIQKELLFKNTELESTHDDLLKAYNKLEEYTIIKERGKIAREMHDTVGHTLTTALVELEVSRLLFEQGNQNAKNRMNGAVDQVRKGLYDLRKSVRTLKDEVDYVSEINELILNTTKHTDIHIKAMYDSNQLRTISPNIVACIYRILQEGITNGIKHGKANAFLFKLEIIKRKSQTKRTLKLLLEDNGDGITAFKKGFGINAMEERVKELKGTVHFETTKGSGFTIIAEITV
ncbi:sensor histidine kinase [Haloplasma contractile]|uniref:histidine kinase n=1 Tax=Haloplasma contractile SSD-17B TaxID=1033810 RepID=U2FGY0_9MOLU|nr:histidine kinase [Haloplasma contractile]ERJ12110.1 two-component system NarL family sensor histidine kinase DesK protein [Haloplasma contractile SSD-17B]